jgi:hypothetical protein
MKIVVRSILQLVVVKLSILSRFDATISGGDLCIDIHISVAYPEPFIQGLAFNTGFRSHRWVKIYFCTSYLIYKFSVSD